jgi:transcriptional regulator, propionate catabolism operon regulatory protein
LALSFRPAPSSLPRIWAIGISRLQALYRELLPEFDGRAEIHIVPKGFDDAVAAIDAAGDGVDVVVAAGSNGAYLRRFATKPVVLVDVTGKDLMQALATARDIDPSVGLVTYGQAVAELERFNTAFGLEFPHRVYRSTEEAEQRVLELKSLGVRAIAGPGLVTDLAARAGLAGVFLYSLSSVRQAFETALEIASAARIESRKRDRLDAVLKHLRDGVVSLDADGRVESLNDKVVRILDMARESAIGRKFGELYPPLADVMSMPGDAESVHLIGGVRYVVSATAIIERGAETGKLVTFQEALTLQRLDRSLRSTHRPQEQVARFTLDDLTGRSTGIARLRMLARRYASADATVVILGESGSGKELVAQGLHNASARRDYPFVAVNCGALPESILESELFGYEEGAFTGARRGGRPGLIEAAHGGTLFLDEIGEMPPGVQVRLLRVLQQREVIRLGATRPTQVDVRVIAATHRDLDGLVANGAFRQDLFYRLNILRLSVPPLRARRADVLPLAAMLFRRALIRNGISLADGPSIALSAWRALTRYGWPGNVRELENVIERLAVHASIGSRTRRIDARLIEELVPEMHDIRHDAPRNVWREERYAAHDNERHGYERYGDERYGERRGEQYDEPYDEPRVERLKARGRANERALIERALDECRGDRDQVCRRLGISKSTLWRRLREPA